MEKDDDAGRSGQGAGGCARGGPSTQRLERKRWWSSRMAMAGEREESLAARGGRRE
jgi:hypothetical protein